MDEVEKSLDEMLEELNVANDEFVNNYFSEEESEENEIVEDNEEVEEKELIESDEEENEINENDEDQEEQDIPENELEIETLNDESEELEKEIKEEAEMDLNEQEDFFNNMDESESNKIEETYSLDEIKLDYIDINEDFEKKEFGLEKNKVKKVNPEADDILDILDNSLSGEEFFEKLEGEFFD